MSTNGSVMMSVEDWQVSQASEAIRLYIYYNRRKCRSKADADIDSDTQWKDVVQDMVRNKELRDVIDPSFIKSKHDFTGLARLNKCITV